MVGPLGNIMKDLSLDDLEKLPGRRLGAGESFCFRCHPQIACFNRCCRNLNLFLYPYDVVRLKGRLGMHSDAFLDRHVDVVLREGSHFPEVLLRMADNDQKTCPFLSPQGCEVYPDRPDTCRSFPLEQAVQFDDSAGRHQTVYFFRPPQFCMGQHEDLGWTPEAWLKDQQARGYQQMTIRWAGIRRRLLSDPWGAEGPTGPRAKMTFMASYNIDRFRDFVFHSSFLKRYRVAPALLRKSRTDDVALLNLGLAWIERFLWSAPTAEIRPR